MKKVLVTGGAGYIGSHTCKSLCRHGFSPVVYDNLVYGHRESVKWGDFIHGDINDIKKLTQSIKEHNPVGVIHFAAFAYVGESVSDPGKYYANNVAGTINLLEAMRINGMDKIVFSSTCAVYGQPENIPITENEIKTPVNPYGKSKLMIEQILADYYNAYYTKSVSLRYFNASGADAECETGENHDPETHLIPIILDNVIGKREKITVFGNDYDTKDGTCIRDYIHVQDLAEAHVKAFNLMSHDKNFTYDCFNLGTGQGYSIMEIIKTVEKVTGKKVNYEIGERRAGDPPVLVANAKKAYEKLNWKPESSSLDYIIKTAWNWHKKLNKNL